MAYNSGYNPDALPAHAEPEQAAQMISYQQRQQQQQQQQQQKPAPVVRPTSHSNPAPFNRPSQVPYQNRPPPPIPQPVMHEHSQHQAYPRPSANSSYNSYNTRPYGPASSPPQPGYGFGPPPTNPPRRSPPVSRPPGTPAPPSGTTDSSLFPLFQAVDKDQNGQLTARELEAALVNGDFTTFDPHTVRMMVRMFDGDGDGAIDFDEFCKLWSFLAAWRNLFDRFDEDRSGYISLDEFSNALTEFGYHLTPSFVSFLFKTYDKSKGGGNMSFDLFVQSCISLKKLTDIFKGYDKDRDGYIMLSFEEFLTEMLRQR
ncbi:EF-hand domain pair [Lasallia pustulata]|uniref:EF-hand domain pair n=1 Tax=Lasallia pustulata TaxID=136370 RepID=A0A1W5DAH9_9LECA|nr:EF-hand domain pair [Lasallia pustulata]